MAAEKKWPIVMMKFTYWLILACSILAFLVLYIGVGMSPGNYSMPTKEMLVFLLFPATLLGSKFLIHKLDRTQGEFKLLTPASIIPLLQLLCIYVLT